MRGDSGGSSKNSGLWIPDHSWRFIVDQDPVSSNQGASAVHEQLRGGAIQPPYMGKKLKILNVVWADKPSQSRDIEAAFCKLILWTKDFTENAHSSCDRICWCVSRMLHRTVHLTIMHTVALLFTTVTYGSFSDSSLTWNDAISDEIYIS